MTNNAELTNRKSITKEEDDLTNRPFLKKYLTEWAIAFVWHCRRQRWRIAHLRKEQAQIEHSNQLLVQHNYVLMRQVAVLENTLKELQKKCSEYKDNAES